MKKTVVNCVIIFSLIGLLLLLPACSSNKDWRTASRESAGIAPDPAITSEAVIQVYGADAWGWRGIFAIHTWISAKRSGEDFYTVYDVVGWRERHGKPVLGVTRDIPDRFWYGEKPKLLREHRGKAVEVLIDQIESAVNDYPWKNTYSVFPGPNSNTFTAWVVLNVPGLDVDLPFSAIGSSYAKKSVQ